MDDTRSRLDRARAEVQRLEALQELQEKQLHDAQAAIHLDVPDEQQQARDLEQLGARAAAASEAEPQPQPQELAGMEPESRPQHQPQVTEIYEEVE